MEEVLKQFSNAVNKLPSTTASCHEVERLFRQAAKRLHPDKNPDNQLATQLFQELNDTRDKAMAKMQDNSDPTNNTGKVRIVKYFFVHRVVIQAVQSGLRLDKKRSENMICNAGIGGELLRQGTTLKRLAEKTTDLMPVAKKMRSLASVAIPRTASSSAPSSNSNGREENSIVQVNRIRVRRSAIELDGYCSARVFYDAWPVAPTRRLYADWLYWQTNAPERFRFANGLSVLRAASAADVRQFRKLNYNYGRLFRWMQEAHPELNDPPAFE